MTLSVPKLDFGYLMGSNPLLPLRGPREQRAVRTIAAPPRSFSSGFAGVPTHDPDHRPHHGQSDGEPPHRRPTRTSVASLRLATSAGEGLPEEASRPAGTRPSACRCWMAPAPRSSGTSSSLSTRPDCRRGSPGEVVPGFEIRVVDEEGNPVPDGTMGHLWVRGGSAHWLRQQLDKSQTCFRGEWVVTGDLVKRDADGYYTQRRPGHEAAQGPGQVALGDRGRRLSPATPGGGAGGRS